MYCSFITDSFWNNTENKRKTPLKHYFVLTWTNERDKVLNAFHSSKLTSFPTPTFPQREKPHPKSPEPKNPPARSNSALPDTGRFPANARWGEGGGCWRFELNSCCAAHNCFFRLQNRAFHKLQKIYFAKISLLPEYLFMKNPIFHREITLHIINELVFLHSMLIETWLFLKSSSVFWR